MTKATGAKKDVIYVDIEDDITSVIEKVKEAESSIVALVPPKRIGVLQSIVNLKLLQRAAKTAKKHVVLITNDHGLMALSADLSIPVAKNLQSKPIIPIKADASSEEDDVINGDELPVGEHMRANDMEAETVIAPAGTALAAEELVIDGDAPAKARASGTAVKKDADKKNVIPNFDIFRKKMFIFGGLGVLAFIFLVWAIFFAGHATVAITAKTNVININKTLQLKPSGPVDAAQGVAPAVLKEIKKSASATFVPTGKKDVGSKASGTVTLYNCDPDDESVTIPTGAAVSSGGLNFIVNSGVTISPSNFTGGGACKKDGNATVSVTAQSNGDKYNIGTAAYTVSGVSSVSGTGSAMTGGVTKLVTVVSQEDIDKATAQLQAQKADTIKAELLKQFDDTTVVIQESYKVTAGTPTSVPALDQEATSAKLTAETTYRMVGISRANLIAIYDTYTKSQIAAEKSQKIYKSGDEDTTFSQFTEADGVFKVRATATAQVGPNIDETALAAQVAGKRAGEIQQLIEAIQGVEDVNVKLSPFWVTKAPSDTKKIDIEFVVNNG